MIGLNPTTANRLVFLYLLSFQESDPYLKGYMHSSMEEPREQCTVVFALIVTEHATEGVFGEGGGLLQPSPSSAPLPQAGSVTTYAKTTVHCSPKVHPCNCTVNTVQYSIEDNLAATHHRVGNATYRPIRTPAGIGMTGLQPSTSVQVKKIACLFLLSYPHLIDSSNSCDLFKPGEGFTFIAC